MTDFAVVRARARTFGAFADAYERARPGYPKEAAEWLAAGAAGVVVEVGAGTGKLTRVLASPNRRIIAVEPDHRMRAVLAGVDLPGVDAVDGSAESIPVPDGMADVVVSGSAFHWFDLDPALREAARVLHTGGTLSFAWNQKDEQVDWVRRMNGVMRRGKRWAGDRPWADLVGSSPLFGPVEHARFAHVTDLPRRRIGDYLCSYTGVAALPDAERAMVVENVEAIVAAEFGAARTIKLPFVVDAYRTVVSSAGSSSSSR